MEDPCMRFPPEILEMLWNRLEENELLSCRLVSRQWRCLLEGSPVWRRWVDRGTAAAPWEAYLELGKRAAAWARGRLTLSSLRPGGGLLEEKIFIGSEYVYLMKKQTIYFYDLFLREVLHEHTVSEDKTIVKMKCSGVTLALLMRDRGYRYHLEVVVGRESVLRRQVRGRAFCVGRRGEVLYTEDGGGVCVRAPDGGIARLEGPPGEALDEIMETDLHYAGLATHPVRFGAGFTVYRREKSAVGGSWAAVYCAESRSPLATLRGSLVPAGPGLIVREVSGSEHWTTGRHLLLTEAGCRAELDAEGCWLAGGRLVLASGRLLKLERLGGGTPASIELPARPLGVHPRGSSDLLVVCEDGSLHYLRADKLLYSAGLGEPLRGAKFAGDAALLWAEETLYTLTVKDLDDKAGPFSDLAVISHPQNPSPELRCNAEATHTAHDPTTYM